MKLQLLVKSWQAYRARSLGDAVAYKAAALTEPGSAQLVAAIRQLRSPLPQIELAELAALAPQTFGHAYHAFMVANELTPLTISTPVVQELAAENVVAVRYVLLHDAFHVILGFDTSLAGELGVWTFVAAQGYSGTFARAATTARIVYPCLAIRQKEHLKAAVERATSLANAARPVLPMPLDEWWSLPLAEVRWHILGAH
jgi:ubiquinone biosynthesis protein COQ4